MKESIIGWVFPKVTEGLQSLWKRFVSFVKIYEPWQLMLIFATPLLIISLFITIPKESEHAKLVPLGFSEIEQIEIDAQRKGKTVDTITNYYAPLNDVLNKVFECWNISLNYKLFGNNHDAFARELDSRKNKIYKYEFDLFDSVPIAADKVLATLKNWIDLLPTLSNVNRQFSSIWDEEHDDEYRTETYTTTDEDGDIEVHTREVYDHTDHTYTYYKKQGEYSYQVGMRMLKYFPRLTWAGNPLYASKTNAEGEYAADRSRRVDRHNQEELFEITRKWNVGSLYMINKDNILEYNKMYSVMKQWEKYKDTAKSVEYETNSHSDDGPEEYQNSEYIRALSNDVLNAISQLKSTILNTKSTLPVLKNKIETYIGVVLEGKQGDKNKLRNEIINMAKDLYRQNFPEGIDLNTFRVWLVFLWAFIASAIGALIAFVLKVIYGNEYDNDRDRYGFSSNPFRYRRY
jgi:hypothetical protein